MAPPFPPFALQEVNVILESAMLAPSNAMQEPSPVVRLIVSKTLFDISRLPDVTSKSALVEVS